MSPTRVYYGWVVVAALCITETVTWGIIYYGYPVFLRPMEEELGASRVAVTGAFSFRLAVSALAAVPVGRWLDRHGPRGLMTLGSCIGTALCLLWARVESVEALYLVWFGMGFAMTATLYEPAFAAVVSWFATRGRDRALLTLTLAAGLASTIFMPIEAWLLSRLGWRMTVTVLAVVLGVVTIPLHALVLRRPPAEPEAAPGAPARATPASLTLGAAARTPVFWVLAVAFVVGNFATVSVTVHLIPYLGDRGYAPAMVAMMIGWMGAMQLPGRLFFVARASSIAQIFGSRHYGAISGAMALGANGARAVGPVGASLLVVALGSYERVFWVLTALLVAVSIGVAATGTELNRGEAAPPPPGGSRSSRLAG